MDPGIDADRTELTAPAPADPAEAESADGEAIEDPWAPRPVADRVPGPAVALILAGAGLAIASISIRRPWVGFTSFALLGLAWIMTRPLPDGEGDMIDHPAVSGSARLLVGAFALLMAVLAAIELFRG